jgi:hypothetical protein
MERANNIAAARAARAARRFFKLAEVASRNGGFWVSAAGGTANVVAGVIASRCGIPVEDARRILDEAGREWAGRDWYAVLANLQPFQWDGWEVWDPWEVWEDIPGRWDVRQIAKAACRN